MNRDKINIIIERKIGFKSWKVKFNELDTFYTDKILDDICGFERYKEKLLYNYYLKLYSLKDDIERIKLSNDTSLENLVESLSSFKDRFDDVMQELTDDKKDLIDKLQELFNKSFSTLIEIKNFFFKNVNSNDSIYFQRRFNSFVGKIKSIMQSFNVSSYFDMELIQEIFAIFTDKLVSIDITKYANMLSEEDLFNSKKSNISYYKIFNPKDMIKLAKEHQYEITRTSGDHVIMIHKITNKIITIPHHSLGYGLMLQIQKQIHQNKVA